MTGRFGVSGCLLAMALICTAPVGQAASPEPSPPWLAYCTKLYGLWYRYGSHLTFHHTGQRARAELALYRCQNGEYRASLEELDVLLARNLLAIPPEPKTALSSR
jgi:hypothetical protein